MNNQSKYAFKGFLLALFVVLLIKTVIKLIDYSDTHRHFEVKENFVDNGYYSRKDSIKGAVIVKGKYLFQTNCASCHAVNNRLIGPALIAVEQRGPWTDRKQIYRWIHNPSEYMKTNKYTKNLLKEYQMMMVAFPNLTNEDVDAILDYINDYSVIKGY